ncbi:hypothetical protein Agabi119p4_4928 [Agaricus bisporus var. burnettii]|uniref:Uncharacterized protein n=1 Tax=Agaricus bisporus var. burnettii TaxID=192524 RepID=A0A8H7KHS6_AGABI|nr:hypothetical protein Agabi119p4_4928 [Agaricus bisporus var. burnettii]
MSQESEQVVKTNTLIDKPQKQSETSDLLHNQPHNLLHILQNQIIKKKEKIKNLRSQFLTGQKQQLEKEIQILEKEIQDLEIRTQKVHRRKLKLTEVQQEIRTQALRKALSQRHQEYQPH